MFTKLSKTLFDTPLAYRLRAKTGVRPALYLKPFDKYSSISDLFIWRMDGYETKFTIYNLCDYFFPGEGLDDHVTLIVRSPSGMVLSRMQYKIQATTPKDILFETLFPSFADMNYGSFSIFHKFIKYDEELHQKRTFPTDRGYTAYKKKNERLFKYVHGNLCAHALQRKNKITSLCASQSDSEYRPMCTFDDIDYFEIAIVNPLFKTAQVLITFSTEGHALHSKHEITLQPAETKLIQVDNPQKLIKYITLRSKIKMLRPVIFKHYGSGFDVFHA